MSLELIHTSAPRGLRPGSRGFTTVAVTEGVPIAWQERLESLSAYESSQLGEGGAVALSHVRTKLAGSVRSVLSRVAPCGLDYSGRPNRIAHHIALDADELAPAGPAWVLSQEGIFRSEWSEEPLVLPQGPKMPVGQAAAAVCDRWREVTGDAGWGGELIRRLRATPRHPIYVVSNSDVNALDLIAEAVALLHPLERWSTTFSTAFQQVVPDTLCAIRFVVCDSAVGRRMRRTPSPGTLDLTDLPTAPPGSEYVEAARAGLAIAPLAARAADAAGTKIVVPSTRRIDGLHQEADTVSGTDVLALEGEAATSRRLSDPSEPSDDSATEHRALATRRFLAVAAWLGWPVAIVLVAMLLARDPGSPHSDQSSTSDVVVLGEGSEPQAPPADDMPVQPAQAAPAQTAVANSGSGDSDLTDAQRLTERIDDLLALIAEKDHELAQLRDRLSVVDDRVTSPPVEQADLPETGPIRWSASTSDSPRDPATFDGCVNIGDSAWSWVPDGELSAESLVAEINGDEQEALEKDKATWTVDLDEEGLTVTYWTHPLLKPLQRHYTCRLEQHPDLPGVRMTSESPAPPTGTTENSGGVEVILTDSMTARWRTLTAAAPETHESSLNQGNTVEWTIPEGLPKTPLLDSRHWQRVDDGWTQSQDWGRVDVDDRLAEAPRWREMVRDLSSRRFFLFFLVYPDSYREFLLIKAAALEAGFQYGVEPLEEATPVILVPGQEDRVQ